MSKALRFGAVLLAALVILAPLYWMVVVAFSSRRELLGGDLRVWPRQFTLENVERVFSSFPVVAWFGNSLAISLVVALLSVTTSLLVATGSAIGRIIRRSSTIFQIG